MRMQYNWRCDAMHWDLIRNSDAFRTQRRSLARQASKQEKKEPNKGNQRAVFLEWLW